MKKNAKYIYAFFLVMIGIISMRILLFIIYEALRFDSDESVQDSDSLESVVLINMTEIALVITITQSLKWSVVTYHDYQNNHNLMRSTSIEHE